MTAGNRLITVSQTTISADYLHRYGPVRIVSNSSLWNVHNLFSRADRAQSIPPEIVESVNARLKKCLAFSFKSKDHVMTSSGCACRTLPSFQVCIGLSAKRTSTPSHLCTEVCLTTGWRTKKASLLGVPVSGRRPR